MTQKRAKEIAGNLSAPSKMPSHSYGLPAEECITGAKLVNVKGSVCNGCYALKGFYKLYAKTVKPSQYKHLEAIDNPLWIEAMVALIGKTKNPWFRWHDSGDLQSTEHFAKICEIARQLPKVRFWLPTREYRFVLDYQGVIPENLTVRFSAHMRDSEPPKHAGFVTSTVHETKAPLGFECKAPKQNNECRDCRACWSKDVQNVSYHAH